MDYAGLMAAGVCVVILLAAVGIEAVAKWMRAK